MLPGPYTGPDPARGRGCPPPRPRPLPQEQGCLRKRLQLVADTPGSGHPGGQQAETPPRPGLRHEGRKAGIPEAEAPLVNAADSWCRG